MGTNLGGIGRLWLLVLLAMCPLPAAQSADPEQTQALAARAYAVIEPAILQQVQVAFVDSFDRNYRDTDIGRCAPALRKLRSGISERALPVLTEVFLADETRKQLGEVLAAAYDAGQLRDIADRRSILPTTQQQERFRADFSSAYERFMQRLMSNAKFSSVMAELLVAILPDMAECRNAARENE